MSVTLDKLICQAKSALAVENKMLFYIYEKPNASAVAH